MTISGQDRGRWIGEAVDLLEREGRKSLFRILPTDRSMVPTLEPGLLVLIDCSVTRWRIGDLLLFRQADYLVVHRFLGNARFPDGKPCLRTRGDANPRLDPPLARDDVVGTAVAAESRHGWRDLSRGGARLFAVGMACHDLCWAGIGAWAAKAGLGRAASVLARMDLASSRWFHGALFRALHARVEPP